MSNIITIELSGKDRELLEGVTVLLGGIYSRLGSQDKTMAIQNEAVEETIAPAVEAPTEPQEAPQEVPQETKEHPAVTHEDIRKKVVALSASGKKNQVQEIIFAVATKVSDIPADKLTEVLAALTALEG